MLFCCLMKGVTPTICRLCLCHNKCVLLNLLCVWIFMFQIFVDRRINYFNPQSTPEVRLRQGAAWIKSLHSVSDISQLYKSTVTNYDCQSSGSVWKSRWLSWAPIPNKPTVFVDVTEPTSTNYECTFHMFTTCDIFIFYSAGQNYVHSRETSK